MAVPLDASVAARLWSDLAETRRRWPAVRWMPPEQYHLTLVFLGATDPAAVPRISSALSAVAAAWAPFAASTGAAGCVLRQRGGGVAWLSMDSGRDRLAALARVVDDAIGSAAYAGAEPRPHLTIARRVEREVLDGLHVAPFEFAVERIELLRSHTTSAGSRYESLGRFALG